MNYKQGLLRFWLVASCGLVVYVFFNGHGPENIDYATRYYFSHDRLLADYRQTGRETCTNPITANPFSLRSNKRASSASPLSQYLSLEDQEKIRIEEKEAALDEARRVTQCLRDADTYEPLKPEWLWILEVFLLPPLQIAGALMLFVAAVKTLRWIWEGFSPTKHH